MSMLNEDDKQKIIQIYEAYNVLMLTIAREMLRDSALAEDAVSESFIRIIEKIDKVDVVLSYKTRSFVTTITKNICYDILRKLKHVDFGGSEYELATGQDDAPITNEMLRNETIDIIKEAIKSLPEILKDTGELSIVHELSNKEIADILNISNDAVRMRLMRARQFIKDRLAGEI